MRTAYTSHVGCAAHAGSGGILLGDSCLFVGPAERGEGSPGP